MSGELWDKAAQNERTQLSWQRTTLSGLACSLVVARLLAPTSLVLAVTVALAAIVTTALLGLLSRRRYTAYNRALHRGDPIGDGRTHLLTSALVVITGAGALVYLLMV